MLKLTNMQMQILVNKNSIYPMVFSNFHMMQLQYTAGSLFYLKTIP